MPSARTTSTASALPSPAVSPSSARLGFCCWLFASTFAWVSWADVFRVTSAQARAETAPALMVFACCFALNIPLDLVQRAQLGLQQGFRMNLWQVGGSLAGLAGVIAGIRMHSTLPLLVAALAGAPVAARCLQHVSLFCRQPARSAPPPS